MDHKHTYKCEPCVFHTTCKRDYERHLLTQKHIDGGSLISKQIIKSSHGYSCPSCNNTFKSRTSIYKHISRCNTSSSHGASGIHTTNPADDIICADDKITITKEMFMSLLQNNQEMMKMIKALAEQSNVNNPTTNTTNNMTNNTINSNNNTFNMNLFLNEKCKDAMNMKDFVNSIQLNLTDLENVDRVGYVKGMSTIIIENLQKTDLYKRPVHCSDVKRETLYVKDDNKWEREGPDHQKMVNAVLAVEQKNVALVGEWAKANPRCMNSHTRENEKYFRLSKVATDGEKDGNIAKVIRNVAKNVAVEKDTNMNE